MVGENDVHIEAHVTVGDMMLSESDKLRDAIEKVLQDKFGIAHITLQFECNKCCGTELIYNHK